MISRSKEPAKGSALGITQIPRLVAKFLRRAPRAWDRYAR